MRVCRAHLSGCAVVFVLLLGSAAIAADATFLETWLAPVSPAHIGLRTFAHKKTGDAIHLLSLGAEPSASAHGYRNKKTGEVIYSRSKAVMNGTLLLRKPDGQYAKVPETDYEEMPVYEVTEIANKAQFIILDDYKEVEEKPDLQNSIVFVPVTGPIHFGASVRNFEQGMSDLAKLKPGCVVIIVDTPGGAISLADRLCSAIQGLRRQNIKCFAYINGTGKGAYSAGAMVCMACERVVMSPGSVMGASIPVVQNAAGQLGDIKGDMGAKAVSGLSAKLRSLAEQSNFPPAAAAAMADKALGLVEITVDGKPEVMSLADAAARKAEYAQSNTKYAERVLCAVGKPFTITPDQGKALGALAGVAETPQELAAIVAPGAKQFAIYEPVDKFAQRVKPLTDKLEALQRQVETAVNGMFSARTPSAFDGKFNECITLLDSMQRVVDANRDVFDEEDVKFFKDLKANIYRLRQQALGT